ncbi:MAG: hypothetical protein PHI72_08955, partial [Atribacterota bacterium]|nr:hypothetical protein [Atribacterota bacterium]
MSRLNRVLLIIVIVLAVVTALVWFKPDLLTSFSLSSLNPFSKEKSLPVTTNTSTAQLSPGENITTTTQRDTAQTPQSRIENTALNETEEELTPFEKEIRQ